MDDYNLYHDVLLVNSQNVDVANEVEVNVALMEGQEWNERFQVLWEEKRKQNTTYTSVNIHIFEKLMNRVIIGFILEMKLIYWRMNLTLWLKPLEKPLFQVFFFFQIEIQSELFQPKEGKCIKSINVGGRAGGTKYICQGIFFKFALDDSKLFGGHEWVISLSI